MKAGHFIPYGKQWIIQEDINEVVKVLKTDWITQGPKIIEFEETIAKYCNVAYGVALSSGTAALQAAYVAAGLKEGDEIITTPLTFAATANMAIMCGARPVFADINEDTLTIDPKEIEKRVTKRTRAIAPVDFGGHPCEYREILTLAKKYRLTVIADAAHALGSLYNGEKVGSLADMTILSFHPVKTITTAEGGMVLTNNKRYYEILRAFRHHQIKKVPEKGPWYYEVQRPGYNFRITDMQCALGLSQFKRLGGFIKRRREIVSIYNKAFQEEALITIKEKSYATSAWHLYVIQLEEEKLKTKRREIFEALQKAGIGVQVHYIPLHIQPFYKKTFGYKKGDFPKAEYYYERAITLPLFPKMTDNEVKRVIKTVKTILAQYSK